MSDRGFEGRYCRPPQADQALIRYSEFLTICHVKNHKEFAGFWVKPDGLYVNLPDDDTILTPEERSALAWHPTGHFEKPALPLPCTLAQLDEFVADAGLAGCIDEDALTKVISEQAGRIAAGNESNALTAPTAFSSAGPTHSARRAQHDMTGERGCRRLILENWDKIESLHGPKADGRQVLRVIAQQIHVADRKPVLKTVQNCLPKLRQEGLIP